MNWRALNIIINKCAIVYHASTFLVEYFLDFLLMVICKIDVLSFNFSCFIRFIIYSFFSWFSMNSIHFLACTLERIIMSKICILPMGLGIHPIKILGTHFMLFSLNWSEALLLRHYHQSISIKLNRSVWNYRCSYGGILYWIDVTECFALISFYWYRMFYDSNL